MYFGVDHVKYNITPVAACPAPTSHRAPDTSSQGGPVSAQQRRGRRAVLFFPLFFPLFLLHPLRVLLVAVEKTSGKGKHDRLQPMALPPARSCRSCRRVAASISTLNGHTFCMIG